MNPNAEKFAILSSVRAEKKKALASHSFNELVMSLQTTLEVEQVLALFSNHLNTLVPHRAYTFANAECGISLKSGKADRHSCSYMLMLENENLGEWRMTRGKKFTESELASVEACLCRLLYPLRNALQYKRALQSAYLDPLTQTRNRGALMGSLQREWELAQRYGNPLSVVLLDVDHFKAINDTYGHDAGDLVLREVARSLKESVRGSDMVFRLGGEEFVLLLSNTSSKGAALLAERVRRALERKTIELGVNVPIRVTASFGVATMIDDENKEILLKRADQAMYRAKLTGRNRVEIV